MSDFLIVGAGRIGMAVAKMLLKLGYTVELVDNDFDAVELARAEGFRTSMSLDGMSGTYLVNLVGSDNPVDFNYRMFERAIAMNANYFDASESQQSAEKLYAIGHEKATKAGIAVCPMCGLAPGWSTSFGHRMLLEYGGKNLKIMVGALPRIPVNNAKYSLTWSTQGLVNEYTTPGIRVAEGELVEAIPLEGYETLTVAGIPMEAFYTSGGIGTLPYVWGIGEQIVNIEYKTLRYEGHLEVMRRVLDIARDEPVQVLDDLLPRTHHDVVYVHIVTDTKSKTWMVKPTEDYGGLTAIQLATASGIVAPMMMHKTGNCASTGFLSHDFFDYGKYVQTNVLEEIN